MGGLGIRLNELSQESPKSMMEVWGRPFIYYQIELMKRHGLKNFIFCIGYKAEKIKNYFLDGRKFGIKIEYSFDGKSLLGTGGAVIKALPLLGDDFIVIYGDSYMDVDYSELIYQYNAVKRNGGKKGLMAVFNNRNKFDLSNVIFKNGKLIRYNKKNATKGCRFIDYGISMLNRDVLSVFPKNKFIDLADIYNILVKKKLMAGYEVYNRFYEIGSPASLREFKDFIYKRLFVKKPAVMLDRDGTINELCFNENTQQLDSPLEPEELRLLPKVIYALKVIKSLGYLIIVVSNQPAAAKGKASLSNLYSVNNRLREILLKKRAAIDEFLFCPHHPVGSPLCRERFLIKDCRCRKPKAGLLRGAIKKLNISIKDSFMAGDSYTDIIAGEKAGLKTVFLGIYKCDTCRLLKRVRPKFIFNNLADFALFLKNKNEDKEI